MYLLRCLHLCWILHLLCISVLLFRLNLQRNALPVTTSGCPGRTFATTQDVEQAPTTSKAVVEAIGGTVVRVLRLLPGPEKIHRRSTTNTS